MKRVLIFMIAIAVGWLWLSYTNKVNDRLDKYWQEQEELCQAVGWYSTTGKAEDCQPVEAVKNYLENK